MISVQKAIELILDNTHTTNRTQKLPIYYAKNFILAQEIFSDRDYPPFNRATMDGYAIRFNDFSIDRQWNVIGEIYAGDNWDYPNLNRELPAIKIMTGAAVPEDFDVVIKIEDTNRVGNKIHILSEKVKQWMNIAKKGEDTQSGNTIVSQGTLIDDSILTIAGSMGQLELNVFEPPTVSIFSTGNEIVPMGQIPNSNQIRDSNTILIESMFQNFKSKIKRKVLLPDDLEIIKNHLDQSSDSDFCVITGGVSAGDKDYIPKALESIGAKEIFHKAMIRPGKPIWFGKKDNTLFFGLPGNPFSARVTFKVFIEPALYKFMHLNKPKSIFLPLLSERKKKHGMEEYFRARIVNKENKSYIKEISSNGSGDYLNSFGTDGIAIHPANNMELPQGINLEFLYW